MRIAAVKVHGAAGWPSAALDDIGNGLTAICGPSNSGKSTMADFMGHTLFGKVARHPAAAIVPDGEVVVEDGGARYRLRRVFDPHGIARFTVAALGGSTVDYQTARRLTGNLSPVVLSPLCAVSFRESPHVNQLLAQEFAAGFQAIHSNQVDGGPEASRRAAELAARRDLLAQELETRIAGQRQASGELETRWRELDRHVREQQQSLAALEERLQSVEKSLAETDARLRYRRLELNVELRWRADEGQQPETPRAEIDAQVEHCRETLAQLNAREGVVRGQLSQVQTVRTGAAAIADQETWLAVSRQLAADLSGEVARLARASASKSCVCGDAHPRLRPIVETIERQLAVLEACVLDHRRALCATEFQGEIDGLARAQAEMRRHLEHLLARRQAHTFGSRLAPEDLPAKNLGFSAADAEILEQRRVELEQERFGLVEQVQAAAKRLKTLRGERESIERERAGLLSARSIEHIQRELATVQQKLELAACGGGPTAGDRVDGDNPFRASDFLAQLTNGDFVQLKLVGNGRQACVVDREGTTIPLDRLDAAQRDQVYLSLCLSLLSAASHKNVWLPLLLDEPFERLDARATAALVAVLDDFRRRGHQVIVFTRKQDATERMVSVGANVRSIASLRRWLDEPVTNAPTAATAAVEPRTTVVVRKVVKGKLDDDLPSAPVAAQSTIAHDATRRRKKKSAKRSRDGGSGPACQPDAA